MAKRTAAARRAEAERVRGERVAATGARLDGLAEQLALLGRLIDEVERRKALEAGPKAED